MLSLQGVLCYVFSYVNEYRTFLISVAALAILTDCFITWRRLSQFNGPVLGVFPKLWLIKCIWSGNLNLELKRVCDEYGGTAVRISANEIVTDDLEYVIKISSAKSGYTRSDYYGITAFDWEANHVFCETDEARHLESRNKVAPGYSEANNLFLEPSVDTEIEEFLQLIDERYTSKENDYRPVDFSRIAKYFSFDAMTKIAFGKSAGLLLEDEDANGYCSAALGVMIVFDWLTLFPFVTKIGGLPLLRNFLMPSADDTTGIGAIMGFARQAVKERYESDKKPKRDLLGSFIRNGVKQRQAEPDTAVLILAGTDTIVTTLCATLLFIVTHPQVHARLQAELDSATLQGYFNDPIISDTQARSLPYLVACIRESLRMLPPVWGTFQKVAPPEGDYIDGKYIPGGTRVAICVYGILRSKKIFGQDADLFRPERWLEADREQLALMIRAGEVIFGSGKYSCLGKGIANMEIRKTVATLLRHYNFTIQNATMPWVMRPVFGMIFQQNMWVKIERRK